MELLRKFLFKKKNTIFNKIFYFEKKNPYFVLEKFIKFAF